jgi:hypothetical protein
LLSFEAPIFLLDEDDEEWRFKWSLCGESVHSQLSALWRSWELIFWPIPLNIETTPAIH